MERRRRDPERADPITRLVAGRVRALRDARGISGATLGAAVRALGLRSWAPATVGKLETMRRQSITVQEWLALSVALSVPPIWLLIDAAGGAVPIAAGVKADPHAALMWLTGRSPMADPAGAEWETAARVIALAHQIAALTERHAQLRAHREIVAQLLPDDGEADRAVDDERQERRTLEDLARVLIELHKVSFPAPVLPGDVTDRATALGVELLIGDDVTLT